VTAAEREKVAALVEAAYREGWESAPDDKWHNRTQTARTEWPGSYSLANLDDLLSEPEKGGPCETCGHIRTRYTTGSKSPAWCNRLTDDDDEATLVTCAMAGGGCWAWEPRGEDIDAMRRKIEGGA